MTDIEQQAKPILLRAQQQAEQLLAAAQAEASRLKAQAQAEGSPRAAARDWRKGRKRAEGRRSSRRCRRASQQFQQAMQSLDRGDAGDSNASAQRARGARASRSRAARRCDRPARHQAAGECSIRTSSPANLQEAMKLVVDATDVRIAIHPSQRKTLDAALPQLQLQWPQLAARRSSIEDATRLARRTAGSSREQWRRSTPISTYADSIAIVAESAAGTRIGKPRVRS